MTPTSEDKFAASVFALGIRFGFVRRADVVRWADRRILDSDLAPGWLMDLSLSAGQHVMDLISNLKRLGKGVDPVLSCEGVYSLLPNVTHYTSPQATALAELLLQVTDECLTWSDELHRITRHLAYNFGVDEWGDPAMEDQAAIGFLQQFVESHRSEKNLDILFPARWVESSPD